MPITRTPMIDDDGSGTTGTIINNAWKQEFYDQIDGLTISGTWTPVDLSGAGLVMPVATGFYVASSKMVLIWGDLQFPATANASNTQFGGLPFPVGAFYSGGYTTYGIYSTVYMPPNGSVFHAMDASGNIRTNVAMSGSRWIWAGQYVRA